MPKVSEQCVGLMLFWLYPEHLLLMSVWIRLQSETPPSGSGLNPVLLQLQDFTKESSLRLCVKVMSPFPWESSLLYETPTDHLIGQFCLLLNSLLWWDWNRRRQCLGLADAKRCSRFRKWRLPSCGGKRNRFLFYNRSPPHWKNPEAWFSSVF